MLVFFAVSGIWQRFGLGYAIKSVPKQIQSALALLSTIHTGRGLKDGANLSSPWMTAVVIAMALSLVVTVVLGVALAFRFGHKRTAVLCLLGGAVIPLLLCLARALA